MNDENNRDVMLAFWAGFWCALLIATVAQGRIDSFLAILVAPMIAGLILCLINYFGLKWLGR